MPAGSPWRALDKKKKLTGPCLSPKALPNGASVPCKCCAACRDYERWLVERRIEQEMLASDQTLFLTLTLRSLKDLSHDPVADLVRAVRKRYGRWWGIRFCDVLERGSKGTKRPHWHVLLHFKALPSETPPKKVLQKVIKKLWKLGHRTAKWADVAAAKYVAKYVAKDRFFTAERSATGRVLRTFHASIAYGSRPLRDVVGAMPFLEMRAFARDYVYSRGPAVYVNGGRVPGVVVKGLKPLIHRLRLKRVQPRLDREKARSDDEWAAYLISVGTLPLLRTRSVAPERRTAFPRHTWVSGGVQRWLRGSPLDGARGVVSWDGIPPDLTGSRDYGRYSSTYCEWPRIEAVRDKQSAAFSGEQYSADLAEAMAALAAGTLRGTTTIVPLGTTY